MGVQIVVQVEVPLRAYWSATAETPEPPSDAVAPSVTVPLSGILGSVMVTAGAVLSTMMSVSTEEDVVVNSRVAATRGEFLAALDDFFVGDGAVKIAERRRSEAKLGEIKSAIADAIEMPDVHERPPSPATIAYPARMAPQAASRKTGPNFAALARPLNAHAPRQLARLRRAQLY